MLREALTDPHKGHETASLLRKVRPSILSITGETPSIVLPGALHLVARKRNASFPAAKDML
jgi:hypothetical protein